MSEELLPCPFCGNENIESKNISKLSSDGRVIIYFRVSCNPCNLDLLDGVSISNAEMRWNTRQEQRTDK